MISKKLEKAVFVSELENNCNLVEESEIEYYLLETENDLLGTKRSYGIEVINKKNNLIESQIIMDFSNKVNYTRSFIKKLADNSVTPTELSYIIDHYLGV